MARQSTLLYLIWRIALAFNVLACFSSMAVANDLFTVSSVAVDSTEDDANAARRRALAEGQERALKLLLEKITLDSDHSRLPVIRQPEVGNFVQGFEIANERRSERRYLADLTVRFKPYAVRVLLRNANIPFTESVSEPIVVLPIFQRDGIDRLWENPNPWRDAWRNFEGKEGLIDLIVPIGELSDLAAIHVEQALDGNRDALRDFASSYGAEGALVAVAKLDSVSGSPTALNVTIQEYASLVSALRVERFIATDNQDVDSLLSNAVSQMVDWLENDWKYENLLAFDEKHILIVKIPVGGLEHWLQVSAELARLAVIRELTILSLAPTQVFVQLHYLGSTDRLVGFLRQRGIDLTFADGHWTLVTIKEIGVEKIRSSDVEEVDIETSDEPSTNLVVDDLPAILPEEPTDSRSSVDKPEPLDDLLVE